MLSYREITILKTQQNLEKLAKDFGLTFDLDKAKASTQEQAAISGYRKLIKLAQGLIWMTADEQEQKLLGDSVSVFSNILKEEEGHAAQESKNLG